MSKSIGEEPESIKGPSPSEISYSVKKGHLHLTIPATDKTHLIVREFKISADKTLGDVEKIVEGLGQKFLTTLAQPITDLERHVFDYPADSKFQVIIETDHISIQLKPVIEAAKGYLIKDGHLHLTITKKDGTFITKEFRLTYNGKPIYNKELITSIIAAWEASKYLDEIRDAIGQELAMPVEQSVEYPTTRIQVEISKEEISVKDLEKKPGTGKKIAVRADFPIGIETARQYTIFYDDLANRLQKYTPESIYEAIDTIFTEGHLRLIDRTFSDEWGERRVADLLLEKGNEAFQAVLQDLQELAKNEMQLKKEQRKQFTGSIALKVSSSNPEKNPLLPPVLTEIVKKPKVMDFVDGNNNANKIVERFYQGTAEEPFFNAGITALKDFNEQFQVDHANPAIANKLNETKYRDHCCNLADVTTISSDGTINTVCYRSDRTHNLARLQELVRVALEKELKSTNPIGFRPSSKNEDVSEFRLVINSLMDFSKLKAAFGESERQFLTEMIRALGEWPKEGYTVKINGKTIRMMPPILSQELFSGTVRGLFSGALGLGQKDSERCNFFANQQFLQYFLKDFGVAPEELQQLQQASQELNKILQTATKRKENFLIEEGPLAGLIDFNKVSINDLLDPRWWTLSRFNLTFFNSKAFTTYQKTISNFLQSRLHDAVDTKEKNTLLALYCTLFRRRPGQEKPLLHGADIQLFRNIVCENLGLPISFQCKSGTDRTGLAVALRVAQEKFQRIHGKQFIPLEIPASFEELKKSPEYRDLLEFKYFVREAFYDLSVSMGVETRGYSGLKLAGHDNNPLLFVYRYLQEDIDYIQENAKKLSESARAMLPQEPDVVKLTYADLTSGGVKQYGGTLKFPERTFIKTQKKVVKKIQAAQEKMDLADIKELNIDLRAFFKDKLNLELPIDEEIVNKTGELQIPLSKLKLDEKIAGDSRLDVLMKSIAGQEDSMQYALKSIAILGKRELLDSQNLQFLSEIRPLVNQPIRESRYDTVRLLRTLSERLIPSSPFSALFPDDISDIKDVEEVPQVLERAKPGLAHERAFGREAKDDRTTVLGIEANKILTQDQLVAFKNLVRDLDPANLEELLEKLAKKEVLQSNPMQEILTDILTTSQFYDDNKVVELAVRLVDRTKIQLTPRQQYLLDLRDSFDKKQIEVALLKVFNAPAEYQESIFRLLTIPPKQLFAVQDDVTKKNILHYACAQGAYVDLVIELIANAPLQSINAQDIYGKTPFMIACETNQPSIAFQLFQKGGRDYFSEGSPQKDVTAFVVRDNTGRSVFEYAARDSSLINKLIEKAKRYPEIVQEFPEIRKIEENELIQKLITAIKNGKIDINNLSLSLSRFIDPDTFFQALDEEAIKPLPGSQRDALIDFRAQYEAQKSEIEKPVIMPEVPREYTGVFALIDEIILGERPGDIKKYISDFSDDLFVIQQSLYSKLTKDDLLSSRSSRMDSLFELSNTITNFVRQVIYSEESLQNQKKLTAFFIKVGLACKEKGDLASAHAISLGLVGFANPKDKEWMQLAILQNPDEVPIKSKIPIIPYLQSKIYSLFATQEGMPTPAFFKEFSKEIEVSLPKEKPLAVSLKTNLVEQLVYEKRALVYEKRAIEEDQSGTLLALNTAFGMLRNLRALVRKINSGRYEHTEAMKFVSAQLLLQNINEFLKQNGIDVIQHDELQKTLAICTQSLLTSVPLPGFMELSKDKQKLFEKIQDSGFHRFQATDTNIRRVRRIFDKKITAALHSTRTDLKEQSAFEVVMMLEKLEDNQEFKKALFSGGTAEARSFRTMYNEFIKQGPEFILSHSGIKNSAMKAVQDVYKLLKSSKDMQQIKNQHKEFDKKFASLGVFNSFLEPFAKTWKNQFEEEARSKLQAAISADPQTRDVDNFAKTIRQRYLPDESAYDEIVKAKDNQKLYRDIETLNSQIKSLGLDFLTLSDFGIRADIIDRLQGSPWGIQKILAAQAYLIERLTEMRRDINEKSLADLQVEIENLLPKLFNAAAFDAVYALDATKPLEMRTLALLTRAAGPYAKTGEPMATQLPGLLGKLEEQESPLFAIASQIMENFKLRPKNKDPAELERETTYYLSDVFDNISKAGFEFSKMAEQNLPQEFKRLLEWAKENANELQQALLKCLPPNEQGKRKELRDKRQAATRLTVEMGQNLAQQSRELFAKVNIDKAIEVLDVNGIPYFNALSEVLLSLVIQIKRIAKTNPLYSDLIRAQNVFLQLATGALPQQIDGLLVVTPYDKAQRREVLVGLHNAIRQAAAALNAGMGR